MPDQIRPGPRRPSRVGEGAGICRCGPAGTPADIRSSAHLWALGRQSSESCSGPPGWEAASAACGPAPVPAVTGTLGTTAVPCWPGTQGWWSVHGSSCSTLEVPRRRARGGLTPHCLPSACLSSDASDLHRGLRPFPPTVTTPPLVRHTSLHSIILVWTFKKKSIHLI